MVWELDLQESYEEIRQATSRSKSNESDMRDNMMYVSTWHDMMFVYPNLETQVCDSLQFKFQDWSVNKERSIWNILNTREKAGKTKINLVCRAY